jgi:serine phosphatase RsbU (regulator of sigma subunit)
MRAAALDGSSPVVATERANRWITRDSQSGMFVTLFYGMLDVVTGELSYTNAGHNPPLLLRCDGRIETLSTPGIALGVIENAPLHEKTTVLESGDLLICYTDGVTEAINEAEEEYGVARLTDVVTRNRHLPAQAIVDTILADLLDHTGRLPAFDDVTLVLLKRAPSDAPVMLTESKT